MEWDAKYIGRVRFFTEENMKAHIVECPQQSNNSDCGVFVLEYVENFLKVSAPRELYATNLN